MVSAFLPEALRTQKGERERETERWWVEYTNYTSALPLLQCFRGVERESRERAGGVVTGITNTVPRSVASVFRAITVDTWHPSSHDTFYQYAFFCILLNSLDILLLVSRWYTAASLRHMHISKLLFTVGRLKADGRPVISFSAQSGLTANLLGVTSPERALWTNSHKNTLTCRAPAGWRLDDGWVWSLVVLPSVLTRDGEIGGLAVHWASSPSQRSAHLLYTLHCLLDGFVCEGESTA